MEFEDPNEDIKQILNGLISKEEVEKAISELKLIKSPGPDRFSAKFYKTMKDEICDFL